MKVRPSNALAAISGCLHPAVAATVRDRSWRLPLSAGSADDGCATCPMCIRSPFRLLLAKQAELIASPGFHSSSTAANS